MFSKELELSISQAYQHARDQRHEYLTVEHMLLALLDNASALSILSACGADVAGLEKDLLKVLADTVPVIEDDDGKDTQPTIGFQRVLQRAVFHVQSSGKKEVNGANVLVAIFGEQESQAVYLLGKHDLTRLDVVNYISHGISKVSEDEGEEESIAPEEPEPTEEDVRKKPLENYATNLNAMAREGKIDPLIGREHEVNLTEHQRRAGTGPRKDPGSSRGIGAEARLARRGRPGDGRHRRRRHTGAWLPADRRTVEGWRQEEGPGREPGRLGGSLQGGRSRRRQAIRRP